MTTTLSAQPRRPSAPAPRPRDLPVLFHLLDVSRPRGFSAKPDEPPPAHSLQPASTGLPTDSSETRADAGLREPSDLAASIAEAAQAPASDEFVQPAAEGADTEALTAEAVAGTGEGEGSAEAEISPATSDAVALRERAEERQRKRQAAARDDWFALHGKYIAIGFVIALLATIYAARSQRKPAPPEVAKPPHVHREKSPGSAVRTASAEKSTQEKSSARPAVAITSVSPSSKTAGESQTALHPPTIPQLATEPATGPASDGLFPWAKREEERVASRTGNLDNRAATEAAASTAVSTAAPLQSPEQHSYPSTPYPGDYRHSAAPAAAPQQPAPSSQPFYPTTNSPSGYRHERSGSGFH